MTEKQIIISAAIFVLLVIVVGCYLILVQSAQYNERVDEFNENYLKQLKEEMEGEEEHDDEKDN